MQEWFVGERAESPVRLGALRRRRRRPARARRARGAAHGRHDRDLPVEPGDLDRADPRRARASATRSSRRRDRVVAISPIVGGAPVKGPADRLMAPLGIEVSCVGVARAYADRSAPRS